MGHTKIDVSGSWSFHLHSFPPRFFALSFARDNLAHGIEADLISCLNLQATVRGQVQACGSDGVLRHLLATVYYYVLLMTR